MAGLSVYPLGNFACFCGLLIFSNTVVFFKKKKSEISPECQTVWTQIRPDKCRDQSYYIGVDCQIELNQRVFLKVTSVLPKVRLK